jgi:DNA-binding transcriptional regulator YiaG
MSERKLYSADSKPEEYCEDYYEEGFEDGEPDYEVNAHTADNRSWDGLRFKDNPKLIISGIKSKDEEIMTKQFSSESRKEMIEKRCSLGLTQTEFSKKTSIPIDAVKQIEFGMKKPTHNQLKILNKELDLKLRFG